MNASIAILPGDGIGPEVTASAVRILTAVADRYGHQWTFEEAPIGGQAIDQVGDPLPKQTLTLCRKSDAILLGAVGGPTWDQGTVRPEQGLLRLRQELGLYANLRPVQPYRAVRAASPLREERLEGVDLVVVRELTGGIYFGEHFRDENRASDLCVYTVEEIERVVRVACRLAGSRRGRLTSVDKANVLETSRLWRETTERVVREEFPDIVLEHLLVDAAAMHLLSRPADFDVIVTENLFGDILSDEASMLAGALGMLPSASLGSGTLGLYEPVHGSAPQIAGTGQANPYGAILSAALLLRYSLGLAPEAEAVEKAVGTALEAGSLTPDLTPPDRPATTEQVTQAVLEALAP